MRETTYQKIKQAIHEEQEKLSPMHPLEYLRRNGWRDYEATRRVWIDPITSRHYEEAEALRQEFNRRTGTSL